MVHLRPGNEILPQTGSGFKFNGEQGLSKQRTENNTGVLASKTQVTGPVETNPTFPRKAMKTYLEWPNTKCGKLVQIA